ncbi:MAG: SRPBCC family protein [Mycobacterium sp.]
MFGYHESIRIAAPAELIYDLVADVTGTGDRSPECRRVEWLGEPAQAVP